MDFSIIKTILEALQEVAKLIFGGQVPPIVSAGVGWILFVVLILGLIWLVLFAISKIIDIVKEKFVPVFYNPDEKRRNTKRRRFAEHIDSEIKFLNRQEAWSDYRFAELEAEVEAEGQRRLSPLIPFLKRTQTGLRREKSLSKALAYSEDRLILLEGEPGAGKSVALRHLTTMLAQKAAKSSNNRTPIPIYVNLKSLRKTGKQIDRPQIYDFVLKSLNRVNDRDVEEFLEDEFDKGIQDGTWLFLFDSFDEIPDVLSSTEADATIRAYATAISDFLHGMNQCRGIVASRQFRGPGAMGWPKFTVLQLSEQRQAALIKNAGMENEKESIFLGSLGVASHEIRSMASNPMFLGLVCDHYKMGNPFPENPHGVFATYLNSRFIRDEERVKRRFGLSIQHLRALAENIAFCMAADTGLGLNPTRAGVKDALERLGFKYNNLEKTLDSLEFMKIARSDGVVPGESKPFTFAHRRFQEYFATSVVLREPERVNAHELLLNAQWRETAVVVCQTQPDAQLTPIYENLTVMLQEMVDTLKFTYPAMSYEAYYLTVFDKSVKEIRENVKEAQFFVWPANALHILSLLQSGFGSQISKLPEEIRNLASKIVFFAYWNGTLLDKKWALEVAGCIPSASLIALIEMAFETSSQFLKDIAYRQVAQLDDIPTEVAKSIRGTLLNLFLNGRLQREKNSTYAHLSRLPQSVHFLQAFKLLRVIPLVDFLLITILFFVGVWCSYFQPALAYLWVVLAFLLYFSRWTLTKGGFFLQFIGILIRLLVVLIPLGLGNGKLFFIFYVNWAIIALICLSWALFSLLAIRAGKFLSPYFWLIMFMFPVVEVLKEIGKADRKLLPSFTRRFISISFSVVSVVLVVNLLFSFLAKIPGFEKVFTIVLGAFTFLYWGWKFGGLIYAWLHDEYIINKFLKYQSALSTLDFIGYHFKFSTSKRSQFVKTVRLKGMLVSSSADVELLKWFCVFVENILVENRINRVQKRRGDYRDFEAAFINKTGYTNARLPLKKYDAEFLDELYTLLEQTINLSKQD